SGAGIVRDVRSCCLYVRAAADRGAVRSPAIGGARRERGVDREQALDTALGQIERAFGKGAVMKMNDAAAVSVGAVSSGSLSLDLALGIGGLPRGRIVEIFGPESSGKTTLVYHVIAEAQRRGGICAFIDAEHSMDPQYARHIGVNIDDLLVSQPDTGEQALEITELLIRSGALDVVAVDSVAALTPKAEIDIIYGSGISWEGTVLDSGLDRKVVTKSGSYFSFGDERLGQGRQNATAFLREHPDVTQQILAKIQTDAGPDQVVSARLLPTAVEAPAEEKAAKEEAPADAESDGASAR